MFHLSKKILFLRFCFSLTLIGMAFSQIVDNQFGSFVRCKNESLILGEVDTTTNSSMKIIDDRQLVSSTKCYPYSTVVSIRSDDFVQCTGVLISTDAVLTSAICLFDILTNRTFESATVYPAQNGDLTPFGRINNEDIFIHPLFNSVFDLNYNFGVLILETPVGLETGWMDLKPISQQITSNTFHAFLQGYAQDIGINMQSRQECTVMNLYDEVGSLQHNCFTSTGMSGSPLYVPNEDGNKFEIVGLHVGFRVSVGGDRTNLAAGLQDDVVDWILSVIQQ